jgi:hypothetical protein
MRMADVWEHQEGEPPKAYAAFAHYLDTPAAKRGFRQCSQDYYGDEWTESRVRQYERWSQAYRWQARVIAYDEMRLREKRARAAEEIEAMRDRHVEEAQLAQDIGIEALTRTLRDLQTDKDARLSPALSLQLIQQGSTIERLTRGEPTEITNTSTAVKWSDWVAKIRADRGLPDEPSPFEAAPSTNGHGNGTGS